MTDARRIADAEAHMVWLENEIERLTEALVTQTRAAQNEIERLRLELDGTTGDIAKAIHREREACARVADEYTRLEPRQSIIAVKIAAEIRARKDD